jgi:hypothetical protein
MTRGEMRCNREWLANLPPLLDADGQPISSDKL